MTQSEFYALCNPNTDPGCVLRNSNEWSPNEALKWHQAEVRAQEHGCTDVYNVLVAQRLNTQGKFWTVEVYREGMTVPLEGHVDSRTYQIRVWTEAGVGVIIHEAVHVTMHNLRNTPTVEARILECGGTFHGDSA